MRVVLTGGPHAGKTTLLNALGARGIRTVPEAAIEEIRALAATLGADNVQTWLPRQYATEPFAVQTDIRHDHNAQVARESV